jgi:hypothetical protein
MKRTLPISDYDLIRYYEGDVEDPAELAAIENAIDSDPVTRLRLFTIADEFATIGLQDLTAKPEVSRNPDELQETQASGTVASQHVSPAPPLEHLSAMIQGPLDEQLRSQREFEAGKHRDTGLAFEADQWRSQPLTRQVEEILVLTREFEAGREPKVGLAFEDERWRSLGGYAAYAPLAHLDAAPRIRKRQPVEYSLGVIRVHDLVENIPYGVVKIVLLTTKETAKNPKRMVGGFLVAIPRESPTGEDANYRFARLVAANHINAAINPLEVEVRAIAARDNDSLAMFPASQVRALLEQQSPPLDDELRGSIQRLLDRLESKS